MRSIALNVLTLNLVVIKLCMLHHYSLTLLYSMKLPCHNILYVLSLEHNPKRYGCPITTNEMLFCLPIVVLCCVVGA